MCTSSLMNIELKSCCNFHTQREMSTHNPCLVYLRIGFFKYVFMSLHTWCAFCFCEYAAGKFLFSAGRILWRNLCMDAVKLDSSEPPLWPVEKRIWAALSHKYFRYLSMVYFPVYFANPARITRSKYYAIWSYFFKLLSATWKWVHEPCSPKFIAPFFFFEN